MSGKEKEKEKDKEKDKDNVIGAKQSLLVAKEVVGLLKTFYDGDDVEEHLHRVDDMADIMMIDSRTKYQAMLLSMEESVRGEFSAWLKNENLKDEVRGDPEALKKRMLEKFRVRKTILERVAFVTQPRREGKRIVADVLERQRVYNELLDEMMKKKERLLVEATLQLLNQEDRADYCNLYPQESNRAMNDLLDFIRRKEEEKLREESRQPIAKKKAVAALPAASNAAKTKLKRSRQDGDDETEDEDAEEERERLFKEGRCFVCKEPGHIAALCPLVRVKNPKFGVEDPKKKMMVAGATRDNPY